MIRFNCKSGIFTGMKIPIVFGVFALMFSILILSCEKDHVVDGMKPVYFAYDDFSGIQSIAPKPFGELGKIVTKDQYIFINEQFKGIHVIDNSDPERPERKYFWQIPGNREFTILQNTLYADNGLHLIVIDITNFDKISVVSVIKDQYPIEEPSVRELYPLGYKGFFECYDATRGIFVEWKKDKIINPKCETN